MVIHENLRFVSFFLFALGDVSIPGGGQWRPGRSRASRRPSASGRSRGSAGSVSRTRVPRRRARAVGRFPPAAP